MMRYFFDVVVVGGGPAGLGVGCALKQKTNRSFVVIEAGKSINRRNHSDAKDIGSGIGGAGLFSDGKFSFFPSSTKLWSLPDIVALKKSYDWYRSLFKKYGYDVPSFPEIDETTGLIQGDNPYKNNDWYLKEYLSIYLSLEQRYDLIGRMVDQIGEKNIMTETQIISYIKNEQNKHVLRAITTSAKDPNISTTIEIHADNVVITGGRFWPLFNRAGKDSSEFMRIEYGVRVQGVPTLSLFTETDIKDPKYILKSELVTPKETESMKSHQDYYDTENQKSDVIDYMIQPGSNPVEYRTFCCCRNGEVVASDVNGFKTFSGRSDCTPTNKSNTGFNVRIMDVKLFKIMVKNGFLANSTTDDADSEKDTESEHLFYDVPIQKAIESDFLNYYYGSIGAKFLVKGLRHLLERFPDMTDTTLSGPTLEGVGFYPKTDDNLKMYNDTVWIAGDACGKFRGITASAISGYYVGLQLV